MPSNWKDAITAVARYTASLVASVALRRSPVSIIQDAYGYSLAFERQKMGDSELSSEGSRGHEKHLVAGGEACPNLDIG